MDPNTLFMYMSIIGPYLESQPYVRETYNTYYYNNKINF